MANTLLTIQMITKESLRVLKNHLVFAGGVSREYDDKFAKKDAKIGNTLDIRKPPRFTVSTGQALDLQDVQEEFVTLTLDQQNHVDTVFSSQERLLDINAFSRKFMEPKIASLANRIDLDGLALYKDVYNALGSPGTVPATSLVYLQAMQRLAEEAAPMDNSIRLCYTPEMNATIVDALKGLFQQATEIGRQYKKGEMGRSHGFTWYMDQNVNTHTSGTFTSGSTPKVNGASQTGNSLVTDGWAASTAVLLRGDIITLGVNAVNPQNRQDTGSTRQFVATDDVTSDGSGNATIPIKPSIKPSADDPFRTVTASPANDATVTPLGAEDTVSPNALLYHPDAFTLGMVDMPLYKGLDEGYRVSDPQQGFSIRVITDYDINVDRAPTRIDVLYGFATLYPELAVRMPS